jgi:hypothetical protein
LQFLETDSLCGICRSENKDGNFVFDVTRIANDLDIRVNEVFDHLQQLKVRLNLVVPFLFKANFFRCSPVLFMSLSTLKLLSVV